MAEGIGEASTAGGEAAWRRVLINGAVSWLITLVGNASAFIAYFPLTPRALIIGWGAFVAALLLFWAGLMAAAVAGRKRNSIIDPRLRRQRLILEIWTWLSVLAVIWLLMPFGTIELQLVTLLFVTCYTATTAISSADQPDTLILRIAFAIGSVAIVTMVERLPYWPFIVAFLIVFALSLFALAQLLERNLTGLRVARAAAEAERDARSRFLASASHDLGQPLQAARLFFEQAIRSKDAEAASRAASDARHAFDAMERLIRQILDHLRIESGQVRPDRAAVALAPIFSNVVSQFAPVAELSGLQLRVAAVKGSALGDGALIERCLGNLVDNALKHSGGTRVVIGTRRRGDRLRLWVIDDGCGATVEKGPQAATRGGFGIGLASVRGAAALMQGEVWLDPRWARGSAFCLEIPAA